MRSAWADAAIEAGEAPIVLVTIALPSGRRLRVASEACSIATRTSEDGPYAYQPLLLSIDEFTEELDPFALGGVGSFAQARIEVATDVDVAALQAAWQHLSAARVEVAYWWRGQPWHERHILLDSATVQGLEFGGAGEPLALVLEAAPPVTSAAVGDASRDLGADFPGSIDTALDAMTDLSGSEYQIVYGDPESVPGYKIGAVAGSNRLVLAGDLWPDLGAITVFEDGASVGSFTPLVATDYTYVTSLTEFLAASGAYTYRATRGGSASATDNARPALGAGAVLRRLLTDSGLRIDWVRCERALQLLMSWRIGLFLDRQAPAIDVVREQLVPWLPIVEMAGGAGLWYAYADPHLAPIEAELTLGQGLVGRVGRVSMSDRDLVRNSFSLRYTREEFSGEYTATVALDSANDPLCYLSEQLYGTLADEVLDCPISWDATTGLRILHARAARLALPRRRVTYVLSRDLYWLAGGAVCALTDPVLSLASARAVAVAVSRGAQVSATFELVDRTPYVAL